MSLNTDWRGASPEYATASQLDLWPQTNARQAQDRLPELVRRLLSETPGAGQISIRAGDGVALAGKDGVATLERQSHLLPAGKIWFEFGTSQESRRKATKDYEGRKSEASQDVTFIFITVRRWQGKDLWAAEHRADNLFKDVLVLDADDLEAWLQVAPATHLWISEILGLQPRDALTLETWWDRFSSATEPVLPLNLFVAGRYKEVQRLRSLLSDEPRITSIQTEWSEDAVGFLHASLTPDDGKSIEPCAVTIVRSAEVWNRIVALRGHGILVPDFDNADVFHAVASGRHVVSIVDNSSAMRRSIDIRLPRVGRHEAAEAFTAGNVGWRQADRLAVLARRSMPALARQISRSPRVQRPAWSQPPLATTLTALMLASRWTNQPEDLQVLSELVAAPLADLKRSITEASRGSDPAIRSVRNVFLFTSIEEAFLEFGNQLSSELVSRWAEVGIKVLLDPNPFEGLSSHEQITAQWNGQRRIYSSALKHGIAESLALAGAIESRPEKSGLLSSAAQRVVRDLLRQVTTGSESNTWGAIAEVLPLLAEAAPNDFLSTLEEDLATSKPTVGILFQTLDDPLALGPSGQHHHLLWALEVLCWSPDHLVRATQILTALCRYELPKNSGNNPIASMSTVLCGWVRNTGADVAVRLQALDGCRIVSEKISWDLLKALWPDRNAWVSPPSEPRYQLWKPPRDQMPTSDWLTFVMGLVDRALEWALTDRPSLPWLVTALTKVRSNQANRIIEFLEVEASSSDLDEEIRLNLFEKVRDTVAQHERFQNADWAMPAEQRTRLYKLADLLQPTDDLRRFSYLFGWRPPLLGTDLNDHEQYRTVLNDKRREALDILFSHPDAWAQLSAVTVRAEAPTQVGWTLSTYEPIDALATMLDWLASDSQALHDAATTWVRSHLAVYGPADLRRALEQCDIESPAMRKFLLNAPTESRFWEVIHEFPPAEDLFWSEASFDVVPYKDLSRAIEMLLERGRAWSAIAIASNGIFNPAADQMMHLPSAALILSVLQAALTQGPKQAEATQMTANYVAALLDYLVTADVPVTDLASLEFGYFRLLQHDREAHALTQVLASDPALFVDLVQCRLRGAKQPPFQSNKAATQAEHAWLVLHSWQGFPGRQNDGTLDQETMQAWVKKARMQLSDLDLTDIGDNLIGQTFAHVPVDTDGIWPPAPVRDLIEAVTSTNLENGAITGRLNSRGITSRGVYDGGSQERSLAEQYKQWSLAVQMRWPRTAHILRAIAESYERDAEHEDGRAQLDQDLD